MKKIPLILILLILCVVTARGQPQYTTSDSIPFMLHTHFNDTLATWDSVYFVLWEGAVIIDTTKVLAGSESDTGMFFAIRPPLTKGTYIVRMIGFSDNAGTAISWNFSVVDPSDFKYTGAGCETPTGVNSIVINVKDEADSSAIDGCLVQIFNYTDETLIWTDYTNSLGEVTLMYDDDSLLVKLYKSRCAFTVPETLWIDGDEDTTYYGSVFDPGVPTDPNLCRVWGYIFNLGGSKDSTYTVMAEIETVPMWFDRVLISPYLKEAQTDSNGYWYVDLYPNSRLTPSGTRYKFEIKDENDNHLLKTGAGQYWIKSTVPDQQKWEFNQ